MVVYDVGMMEWCVEVMSGWYWVGVRLVLVRVLAGLCSGLCSVCLVVRRCLLSELLLLKSQHGDAEEERKSFFTASSVQRSYQSEC